MQAAGVEEAGEGALGAPGEEEGFELGLADREGDLVRAEGSRRARSPAPRSRKGSSTGWPA